MNTTRVLLAAWVLCRVAGRRMREQVQREAVSTAGRHGYVHHEQADVFLTERLEGLAHHDLVQTVERLLAARGGGEPELAFGVGPDTEESPARRLRLVGDDRDFRPDEGVQERGLSGVRTSDDGHRAGAPERNAHGFFSRSGTPRSSRLTRTRWIRRRSASSTRKRRPASCAVSPAFGMRPRRSETRPATVSYSSEGNVTPKRLAISGTLTRPATEYEPSSCAMTGGCSSSCSSAISPTSSSTRSSSVARPVTAPYSSTTMASGWRRRRKSDRSVATVCVSGAKKTWRASGRAVAGGFGRLTTVKTSLTCTTPTGLSIEPSTSGRPGNFVFTNRSATSSSGASASANTMPGADG